MNISEPFLAFVYVYYHCNDVILSVFFLIYFSLFFFFRDRVSLCNPGSKWCNDSTLQPQTSRFKQSSCPSLLSS